MQKTVEELFLQGFGFERYYLLKGIDWGKKTLWPFHYLQYCLYNLEEPLLFTMLFIDKRASGGRKTFWSAIKKSAQNFSLTYHNARCVGVS